MSLDSCTLALVDRCLELQKILESSESIRKILERTPVLQLPHWYLGGGCIAQTVWNAKHGFRWDHGIGDFDLGYFDPSDMTYEGEDHYIRQSRELFRDLAVPVQIRNQARVHLWYEQRFGRKIQPFTSIEDAIRTWPTTATCVGVTSDNSGRFLVYSPYGLDDLFDLIVRPNKLLVTAEIYQMKVNRWLTLWPNLEVLPWSSRSNRTPGRHDLRQE